MSRIFFTRQLPIMVIVGAITVSLVAWQEKQNFSDNQNSRIDTIPSKSKKVKNLDEALIELEKGQAELEKALRNFDKEFKIPNPPVPPIPPIDVEKIMADVQKSLKEIDPEKIKADVAKAMKQIDPEELKAAVAEALKDIDADKIKADVEASLSKEKIQELKAEIDRVQKVEMPKIEAELKKIKPEIEKSMKEARVELEKAKSELKEYKAFEDGLDKDGLINKKEAYKIEHKDGQLIINDKVQPSSVYNKYSGFLQKHKKFTLKKTDDDFELNMD